jgi:diadenosine tetraphosphate (Ap4A) HIT family hydrolase
MCDFAWLRPSGLTCGAMQEFTLDPVLAADCMPVGRFALCDVLLMDEARFPWLILVPRRPGLSEIIDLDKDDRHLLMDEIATASSGLRAVFGPDKLNVAALGNQVRQLHVHVIARFVSDAAWPRPVFGIGERLHYPAHSAGALAAQIAAGLAPFGLQEM